MKHWTLPALLLLFISCNTTTPDHNLSIAPIDSSLIELKLINGQLLKDSLNHELWYKKARLSEQQKDTGNAIRYYTYSIKIYPTPPAMLSLANLLAERRDPAALIVCTNISTSFTDKTHLPDLFFIKGVYHARTGNTPKALANFDSCIYSNYRYLEAYMEKGFLLSDQKQIQPALTIFATVLKLDPLYTDGYYWMGKCYEKLGKKDSAVYNYQKALSLDPALTEATTAIKRLQ